MGLIDLLKLIKKSMGNHVLQSDDIHLLNFEPGSVIDMGLTCKRMGISEENLFKLTFHNILLSFCVSTTLQRSRFMSGLIRDKFTFCPQCLKERSYHKLIWQIQDIIWCPIHKTLLQDRCLNCNNTILLKDVKILNKCPYCGSSLDKSQGNLSPIDEEKQLWFINAYKRLIDRGGVEIESDDIAIRLLYILSDYQDRFNRKKLEKDLSNSINQLSFILQYTRNSNSSKKSLHLTYILNILFQKSVPIDEFLNLKVPEEFISSVIEKRAMKKEEAYCLAPWCENYYQRGTLIKTGTSFHRNKKEEENKYYLVCPECGCEYAFDNNDNIIERTYFITGYKILKEHNSRNISIKQLLRLSGLSVDRIDRCLAYFKSRNINFLLGPDISFDREILNKVVRLSISGKSIKQIENSVDWSSHFQFLYYRYHKDVMKKLNTIDNQEKANTPIDVEKKQNLIQIILEDMLENDTDISIRSVCDSAGVCPETIRNWKCNELIAEFKRNQESQRKQVYLHGIILNSQLYMEAHSSDLISSDELYNSLGIIRNVLWRDSPEITSKLRSDILNHNRRIRELLH